MKKLSLLILITILFLPGKNLYAQYTHFSTNGIIEFDKSVNMFALIKKSINKDNESFMQQAFDSYKKNKPQFKVFKSTLSFSKDKTMFTPLENAESGSNTYFDENPMAEQNNVTYTDLSANRIISQKKVFEQTFLLKDSTRKINWKITSETRQIAGYNCRRANALILDSVYVVAFYTDEIMVPGGPELFSGLPGMILGVAIPHENISWFATKVTDTTVPAKALSPPTKGKAVNDKELRATLQSALKDWGNYKQIAMKAFLL
ncbi:GLPGLI family protein [uncultured Mucilaginibacter sp.]|uniref:GLPGLI family protein n=1 Tax=uncultured Mucilaginibacter sp. TaxID=797541 RepID=UPI0026266B58|nr:GLPGLI family protein [uncultured Mucilaginibacter sp.]